MPNALTNVTNFTAKKVKNTLNRLKTNCNYIESHVKKHIAIFRELSRTDFKTIFPQTSEMYKIFITIFKFPFTYSDSLIKRKFGRRITLTRIETS